MAEFDEELDRVSADPAFATRVRAAYSGRQSLEDVVWWQRHPLEPGPSGAPSPAAEREALARQVYARAAAPDDAERRLVEADAAIAADRTALSSALAAALAPAPLARDDVTPAAATAPPVPSSRRRPRMAALVVVALVVAALIGGAGGLLAGRVSAPQSVSTAVPASALSVFDRPATGDDSPAIGGGANFRLDTYRKLEDVAAPDSPLGNDSVASVIYAVRSRDGRACLYVESSGTVAAVTCVADADFPTAGLRIYWREGKILRGATWAADGEMAESGFVTPGSSKDSDG